MRGVAWRFAEAALDLGGLLRCEAERVGVFLDHTQELLGRFILTIARELAELRDRPFESFGHRVTLVT